MRIAMLILLGGCDVEFGLDPIETGQEPQQETSRTETFVQQPLPKVDVLFVVDRTASMAQEHAALASAADVLDDLLAAAGVSWHVGVVGTDMADEEAGWLLGQPWVFTSSSGDLVAHLQSVLVTVEAGVAPPRGLAEKKETRSFVSPQRRKRILSFGKSENVCKK